MNRGKSTFFSFIGFLLIFCEMSDKIAGINESQALIEESKRKSVKEGNTKNLSDFYQDLIIFAPSDSHEFHSFYKKFADAGGIYTISWKFG